MSAGSGHSLALRAIVTQSSCAPRWMVAVYLCEEALGPERSVLIALGSIIAVCGVVLLWVNHTIAAPMDFIERHLGFSPDDGDGSMEVMLLTVLFMIVAAVGFRLTAP